MHDFFMLLAKDKENSQITLILTSIKMEDALTKGCNSTLSYNGVLLYQKYKMREQSRGSLPRIQEKKIRSKDSSMLKPFQVRKYTVKTKTQSTDYDSFKSVFRRQRQSGKIVSNYKRRQIENCQSIDEESSLFFGDRKERRGQYFETPQKEKSLQISRCIMKKHTNPTYTKHKELQAFYMNQVRQREKDHDKINILREKLQVINPLFQKIDIIVSQSLLTIGEILTYAPKEYIYKQNYPINFIGILIWGQAALRNKRSNKSYNFLAGHTIGEETLFQGTEISTKRLSILQKGEIYARQRCRAIKECGFLLFKTNQYRVLYEDLIRWGYKAEIIRFQNILFRNYLKKKPFKSTVI